MCETREWVSEWLEHTPTVYNWWMLPMRKNEREEGQSRSKMTGLRGDNLVSPESILSPRLVHFIPPKSSRLWMQIYNTGFLNASKIGQIHWICITYSLLNREKESPSGFNPHSAPLKHVPNLCDTWMQQAEIHGKKQDSLPSKMPGSHNSAHSPKEKERKREREKKITLCSELPTSVHTPSRGADLLSRRSALWHAWPHKSLSKQVTAHDIMKSQMY